MSRAAVLVVVALAAGALASCAGERRAAPPPPQNVHAPTAVMLPVPRTGPQDPDTQLPVSAKEGETLDCMERELSARHLNAFGDREGTTYEDGTPLGVKNTVDGRISYVFRKRPDIAITCSRALGEPSF